MPGAQFYDKPYPQIKLLWRDDYGSYEAEGGLEFFLCEDEEVETFSTWPGTPYTTYTPPFRSYTFIIDGVGYYLPPGQDFKFTVDTKNE